MAPDWQAIQRMWSRSELFTDTVLAMLVWALSLGLVALGPSGQDHDAGPTWAVVALTALTSLPLALRRRAPLEVFVFTAAASAALRLISAPAGPPLGATVALYFLAASEEHSRSRDRLILVVAVTALAAHALAGSIHGATSVGTALGFGVVVWGGAWLAGERTRLRHEKLAQLEQRAARLQQDAERERRLAVAEERARIARDLHDSAGHALNVILVHAGLGRRQAPAESASSGTFGTIEEVARQTVTEIDQLVGALRDDRAEPDVEPPVRLAALQTLLRRHQEAGLDVDTTIHGPRRPLPPVVDRSAYRILQEALTNTARHGDGHASVELTFGDDALAITVVNAVDPRAAPRDGAGGHGLVGMRERAQLAGGSLDTSVEDGVFRLDVRLPFARRAA